MSIKAQRKSLGSLPTMLRRAAEQHVESLLAVTYVTLIPYYILMKNTSAKLA